MQVHEPIWKWRTQRTKNSIITIPRCNFDFYAPLSVENIQTHSYAISSLAGEKSQLRGKHATVSTTTTSLNGVKGMEKQMRLIKCHFHEFLHKQASVNTQTRDGNVQQTFRYRVETATEQGRSHFDRNWIFYYLMQLLPIAHFNYSNWSEGSRRVGGKRQSPQKQLRTNAFYCRFRPSHSFHPRFFQQRNQFNFWVEFFSTFELGPAWQIVLEWKKKNRHNSSF